MIVIGLGSGRSGTASLAKLLNSQRDSLCFHEMNPSCVRYRGTPGPILDGVEGFRRILAGGDPSMLTVDLSRRVSAEAYDHLCGMKRVRTIGDIAHYYLRYVDDIARLPGDDIRFVCLKRKKDETVASWMRKTSVDRWLSKRIADRLGALITREPYYAETNHFMEHDGSVWLPDPVWDKCFPKFEAASKIDAVRQYWDYYYDEAEKLAARHSERFRIVPTDRLNDPAFQAELLAFCGVPEDEQVRVDAHIHKSTA